MITLLNTGSLYRRIIGLGLFCCHIEGFKRYFALLSANMGCGLGR